VLIYDAIREARAGREAWANIEGRRVRLAPPDTALAPGAPTVAVVRWRGRVVLAVVHEHGDGRVRLTRGATSRRTAWRDVLALVAEAPPGSVEALAAEVLGYREPTGRPAKLGRGRGRDAREG
jgi:hypothetical protein